MAKISATLKDLKDAERMVPITSSFNSPVWLQQKKKRDKFWRKKVDYCQFNQAYSQMQLLCQMCCLWQSRLRWPQVCGIIWKLHSFLSLKENMI